jgi:hypothetical protein
MKTILSAISSVMISTLQALLSTILMLVAGISFSQTLPPGSIRFTTDGSTSVDQSYIMINTIAAIAPDNCGQNVLDAPKYIGPGGNDVISITTACGTTSGTNFNLKSLDLDSTVYVYAYVRTDNTNDITIEYNDTTFNNPAIIERLNGFSWSPISDGQVVNSSEFLPPFFANEDTLGFKNVMLVRLKWDESAINITQHTESQTQYTANISGNGSTVNITPISSEGEKDFKGKCELYNISGQMVDARDFNGSYALPQNLTGIYIARFFIEGTDAIVTKKIYLNN